MTETTKILLSALLSALFGLFLLWQGISGNVVKNSQNRPIVPRWLYIIGGAGMLILPLSYIALILFATK